MKHFHNHGKKEQEKRKEYVDIRDSDSKDMQYVGLETVTMNVWYLTALVRGSASKNTYT